MDSPLHHTYSLIKLDLSSTVKVNLPAGGCIWGSHVCSTFDQYPVHVYLIICVTFFLFWIILLLVSQLLQIAAGMTTNESVNHERLEYFFGKLEKLTNFDSADEELQSQTYSQHTEFKNPFDQGTIRNLKSFFCGSQGIEYRKLDQ